jgi:hypothetical protein
MYAACRALQAILHFSPCQPVRKFIVCILRRCAVGAMLRRVNKTHSYDGECGIYVADLDRPMPR